MDTESEEKSTQHTVTVLSNNNKENLGSLSQSSQHSLTNSISQIRLDEISSFGATKQARLPVLISLETTTTTTSPVESNRTMEISEQVVDSSKQNKPLLSFEEQQIMSEKDANIDQLQSINQDSLCDDYQLVDMDSDGLLIGPSLPALPEGSQVLGQNSRNTSRQSSNQMQNSNQLWSNQATGPPSVQLGDSLIDIVVNLRTENQNLVQALQRNNEFVRQRLDEFKQIGEQARAEQEKFAREKAEMEIEMRKLRTQNTFLSDRLMSMESKLKDLKCEMSEFEMSGPEIADCSSGITTSTNNVANLYPHLEAVSAMDTKTYPDIEETDEDSDSEGEDDDDDDVEDLATLSGNQQQQQDSTNKPGTSSGSAQPRRLNPTEISKLSKEEMGKYFDAEKAAFNSMDDRMKQCDKLEQQLNEIGNRDYEICLLQQQLNIYRQDYRLEKMSTSEAKLQIEHLKSQIDELCLKRIQELRSTNDAACAKEEKTSFSRKLSGSDRFTNAERFVGRIGRQAARSAAKAARYAAKQAHLEEKAAAAASALAAKYSQVANPAAHSAQPHAGYSASSYVTSDTSSANYPHQEQYMQQNLNPHQHHHHRHHKKSNHRGPSIWKSGIKSELWDTANKAMMTGYKMASTHVNTALDKLSEYEQAQANHQLAQNKSSQQTNTDDTKPSAPPFA